MLLAVALMLGTASAADAQLRICNRAEAAVEVAYTTERDTFFLVVEGWLRIAPNACRELPENELYAHAYYARIPGTEWVWEDPDDGVPLCVFEDRSEFAIDFDGADPDLEDLDEFECPAGATPAMFRYVDLPVGESRTINLR